jgi:hypothetical protein
MPEKAEDHDSDDDSSDKETFGPSIERYGDDGLAENLIGLTMEMKFISCEEACRGVVKSVLQDASCQDDQVFEVIWTCGQDPTEYSSKMSPDDIIGWHFFTHIQEPPTWFDERRGTKCTQLFRSSSSSSSSTKLINFKFPAEAEEYFPFVKDDANKRWPITIFRLNDPLIPPTYFGGKTKSYPLSLLLTIIVICKDYDPSTILPIVIASEGNEIFKLTDQFTRYLSGRKERWEELAALNSVAKLAAAKVHRVESDDDWKIAYENVQALVLTLSENFESTYHDWKLGGTDESIFDVCAKIVLLVGVTFLQPPSQACQDICDRDKAFLGEHVMAGSFVNMINNDEDFDKGCPVESEIWKALKEEYEQYGIFYSKN